MSWLRIDDGFVEHPKVADLSDRAFRLHMVALCYCARNLTDGHVTARSFKVVAAIVGVGSKKAANELVSARLWHRKADGFVINDYLEWNPTAAKVKQERESARERQSRSRGNRHGVTDGVTDAVTYAVSHGTPSRPVPKELNPRAVTRPAGTAPGLEIVKDLIDESLKEATP